MNHQTIYDEIIRKAQLKNRIKLNNKDLAYTYYENHHILPKCLGGTNEKGNKVLLTPREHFICHKLLTYIHPHHSGISHAFFRMVFDKIKKREISSADYEYARKLLAINGYDDKTKQKMSLAKKGKTYEEIYGDEKAEELKTKRRERKHTKEEKDKIKSARNKLELDSSYKEKQKNSRLGIKNPMYKKTVYDIWVQKYGKEIADKKYKNWKENISLSSKDKSKPRKLVKEYINYK
jgi:hypothetical protein